MTEQTTPKEGEVRPRPPVLQRIARLLELTQCAAASRLLAFLLIVLFFGAATAWVHNALNLRIDREHPDESTVLHDGIPRSVPRRTNLRVGEMNRWLTKLLYPGGVYYMNLHAGAGPSLFKQNGWEIDGWHYPGGYYLERHLRHYHSIRTDPNIQDFTFFMRLALGLLAAASFCLVLWALFHRFGFGAAAAYAALMLGSRLALDQLSAFYSETTLFIIFNLAAFCYLRCDMARPRPLSRYAVAWLGVLSAAALSTKLSGAMVVAMLAGMVLADVWRHKPRFHLEIYLSFFLAFIYLINVPAAGSWFKYVNETLANVYNYAARSRLYGADLEAFYSLKDDLGVMEFLLSVPGLGYFIILAFLGGLLWLAIPPRRRLLPLYVLGALIILSVSSFSNQMVYMVRNLASIYAAASFIIAIAVGDLLNRSPDRRIAGAASLALLLPALFAATAHRLQEIEPIKKTFLKDIGPAVSHCDSLAAIEMPGDDVRVLRERVRGEVAAFPRVPRYFQDTPISYVQFKEKIFSKYQDYQCLVAYREKHSNTKQVTNFFGPKYYRLARRRGNFFFFVPETPMPGNLAAEAGDNSITLSWTIPDGINISRYRFQVREDGQPWGPWEDGQDIDMERGPHGHPASSATQPRVKRLLTREQQRIRAAGEVNRFVVRGLTNGRAYQVRLRAHTHLGNWGAPAEVAATPTRQAAP